MAESSRPWPGDSGAGGAGDCGPYSADQWDDVWERLFTPEGGALEGVLLNVGSELAATSPSANTVRIAAGAAIVKGKSYINTANVDVTVATPVTATRIDRIVLRSVWSTTQTVRITRIAGAEGGAAPAITQTDANTWDLKLCQVSITTGGVITVTDERVFCHFGTMVATDMLDAGVLSADAAGRAKMAAGFFSADATGQGKFAAGFLTADAGGRALMANGFVGANQLAASIDASGAKAFNADTVDGYHGSDLLGGGVILGAIILWSGTLGGSDGHRPMVGGSTPNEAWHICNGDTVGGVATPDLRDKFVLCAGTTYAKDATGGNAAINFSHNHGAGTYTAAMHHHDVATINGTTGVPSTTSDVMYPSAVTTVAGQNHTHDFTITGATTGDTSAAVSGSSANGLSSLNILPPYIAMYYIMKVA